MIATIGLEIYTIGIPNNDSSPAPTYFGWSIRIIDFIIMGLLIPSCLPIKARLPPRKSNFFLPSAFKEPVYTTARRVHVLPVPEHVPAPLPHPQLRLVPGNEHLARLLHPVHPQRGLVPRPRHPRHPLRQARKQNVLAAAGISSGILALCWQRVQGNAGILVFAAVYGFCSGTIISGTSVSLASVSRDPKNIGTYMGMGMWVASLAALVGPPISDALVNRYRGFSPVADICGVTCLLGAGSAIVVKVVSGNFLLSKT